MAFTFDPETDRGLVRLLIGDVDTANADGQVFEDASIDAFLALENSNVRLAAAQALDSMAASEAMVQKVIRIGDLQTNGAATAKELRARASELRRQAEEGSGDYTGMFDWAEMGLDSFSRRERIWNEALRS